MIPWKLRFGGVTQMTGYDADKMDRSDIVLRQLWLIRLKYNEVGEDRCFADFVF